jgi:hypothetical protein
MKIKSTLICFGSLFLLTSCPGHLNRVYYPYQGTYLLSSITRSDYTIDLKLSTDSYIQIGYVDGDINISDPEPSVGSFSCLTNYNYVTYSFFESSFAEIILYGVNLADFDFAIGEINYFVTTELISSDSKFADSLEMSIVGSSYSIVWSLDKSLEYSAPN